jgi:biopolymer transport protein ExbD/biopolymer transport protein TolR
MNRIETNYFARTKQAVWSVAFLVVVTMVLAAPRSSAQAMQKGISVELAPTTSAVAVPDADKQDALIVTVTESGKIYLGIDSVAPDSLADEFKDHKSRTQMIYIKADARAPYASVVRVVDAARSAGVTGMILLTTQTKTTQAGPVLPEGIEIELARRAPVAAGK